jgi:DNA topoisomerase VI subunit B
MGRGKSRRSLAEPPRLVRTTFRTSRLLDFCSRKELIAQTGHQPADWPLVVLKELVDNALDACEDAGIPPEIMVTVAEGMIQVADNGPGLPAGTIDDVLDFSVRVSSREAYVSPDRGAQGNALKTLVAMPFVVDGEIGQVEITALGTQHEIVLEVDRIRQVPVVHHNKIPAPEGKTGTVVSVRWPDSASSTLANAKGRFLQMAESYTVLNPHLTMTVDWFGEIQRTEATVPEWAKWRPSDPTSPHWYKPEHLARLISAYLSNDVDYRRERTVREFVAEFRGLSGTAKQKTVLAASGLARAPLSALTKGQDLDHATITALLTAMQAASKAVPPDRLGVIGREHTRTRFEGVGCDMETFRYSCKRETRQGLPWVIETAFAMRATEQRAGRQFIVGVNWSPGIVNPFRTLGAIGASLDAILEQQRAGRDEPVVFLLHVAGPRVEFADRGKSVIVVEED